MLGELIEALEGVPEDVPVTFGGAIEGNVGDFQEYAGRTGDLNLVVVKAEGAEVKDADFVLEQARDIVTNEAGDVIWHLDTPLWGCEAGRAAGLAILGVGFQLAAFSEGQQASDDTLAVTLNTVDISDYI